MSATPHDQSADPSISQVMERALDNMQGLIRAELRLAKAEITEDAKQLGILFMIGMLAVLYYLAPNVEQSFRWISPGSVLATVLWIIAVFGFSLYLRFASPGSAYGALSSLLVFLFFLYVTAIVLLIGAELNAILEKRFDPETLEDLGPEQTVTAYGASSAPRVSIPPGPAVELPGYAPPPEAAYRAMGTPNERAGWRAAAVGLVAAVGALILGRLGRRD